MGKRKVKVEFVKDQLDIPAWEVPYPEPLQDVSRIVYNGFTTRDSECRRTFVPLVETELEEHHVGMLDGWPYHLRCKACGAVYRYFDCWTTTGESRVLMMRYCMRCGAKVKEKE